MDLLVRNIKIIFWEDRIHLIEEELDPKESRFKLKTTSELIVAKIFHKVLNKGRVEEIFEKSDYEVLGRMLYEILTANDLSNEVRVFFESIIDQNTKLGKNNRLKIMIQFKENTHELEGLPWEYLMVPLKNNTSIFLAAIERFQFDFIRFYPAKYDQNQLFPTNKISVVWVFVDEGREPNEIRLDQPKCDEIFNTLVKVGKSHVGNSNAPVFEYIKIKNPTRSNFADQLIEELASLEGPYILHFLGHAHMKKNEGPYFGLSSGGNTVDWVHYKFLGDMFKNNQDQIPLPKLVVLQACESAQVNEKGEGIAVDLVNLGIPAVIAMQNEITLDDSLAFAKYFYTKLIEGEDVSRAVTLGRYFLGCKYSKAAEGQIHHYSSNTFGTPVVFSCVGTRNIHFVEKKEDPTQQIGQTIKKKCNRCQHVYSYETTKTHCNRNGCNGELVEFDTSNALTSAESPAASMINSGTSAASIASSGNRQTNEPGKIGNSESSSQSVRAGLSGREL